jgi:hypothetical protein
MASKLTLLYTNLSFLLQVEDVDFLQLSLQPEEESGLVRLQRRL